jgi:hypothetical protein
MIFMGLYEDFIILDMRVKDCEVKITIWLLEIGYFPSFKLFRQQGPTL